MCPAESRLWRSPSVSVWLVVVAGLAIAAAVCVFAAAELGLIGRGADRGAEVSASLTHTSCAALSTRFVRPTDGHHETLYDCVLGSGVHRCVTYEKGAALDVTAVVQFVYLGRNGLPGCAQS